MEITSSTVLSLNNQMYFTPGGVGIGTYAHSDLYNEDVVDVQARLHINDNGSSGSFGASNYILITNSSLEENIFGVMADNYTYCRGLRVRSSSEFPDYVFRRDYKLMTLQELRQFIEKNGHLPNIPTEAEVKKDGIDVEKLTTKMLEKIEELTLYTIQLEEKITAMQKQLDAAKRR